MSTSGEISGHVAKVSIRHSKLIAAHLFFSMSNLVYLFTDVIFIRGAFSLIVSGGFYLIRHSMKSKGLSASLRAATTGNLVRLGGLGAG